MDTKHFIICIEEVRQEIEEFRQEIKDYVDTLDTFMAHCTDYVKFIESQTKKEVETLESFEPGNYVTVPSETVIINTS